MRPLIVLGADEPLKDRLHERWTDLLMFPSTPGDALTQLSRYPHALMAYGPEIFGPATQPRQSALVRTPETRDEPQVILFYAESLDRDAMELDDPLRFVEGAAARLRVGLVLNLFRDGAMDHLGEILKGNVWPAQEVMS